MRLGLLLTLSSKRAQFCDYCYIDALGFNLQGCGHNLGELLGTPISGHYCIMQQFSSIHLPGAKALDIRLEFGRKLPNPEP